MYTIRRVAVGSTCIAGVRSECSHLVVETFGGNLELGVLGVATVAVEVVEVNAKLVSFHVVSRSQPEQVVVACKSTHIQVYDRHRSIRFTTERSCSTAMRVKQPGTHCIYSRPK